MVCNPPSTDLVRSFSIVSSHRLCKLADEKKTRASGFTSSISYSSLEAMTCKARSSNLIGMNRRLSPYRSINRTHARIHGQVQLKQSPFAQQVKGTWCTPVLAHCRYQIQPVDPSQSQAYRRHTSHSRRRRRCAVAVALPSSVSHPADHALAQRAWRRVRSRARL